MFEVLGFLPKQLHLLWCVTRNAQLLKSHHHKKQASDGKWNTVLSHEKDL